MTTQPEPVTDPHHTAALQYAYQHLRVLPIKPGEKRPPMAAWQNAATTDPTIVDAWWTELYRNHGVGIATGQGSGVFVLDVDVSDAKAGDETLAELEATHGPLPDTWTATTGSGGTHYYFAIPAGIEIRNDAGRRLGPGLDIRGEGGQVVAPPTMGRLQRYEWERNTDTPLATPPTWLIELLTTTPQTTTPQPPAQPADPNDSIAARYNQQTTWPQLLTADGWTLAATLPDGEQHWTRPGKDVREGISATTGHAGGSQLQVFTSSIPWLPEGAYSRFGYYACRHHNGNRSEAAQTLHHNQNRQLDNYFTNQTFTTEPTPTEPTINRLELAHLIEWDRFWNDDHADEEWLAEPVIPKGRAISLYAPAKAGKSTIVLAVAAAVATGRPILQTHPSTPTHVLYLDYEMTPADLQERLMELGYGPEDDLHRLHYALLPSLPPLDSIEGARALLELVDTTGAQLVIVDTFGRAVEGDEDSADTVRAFYRHTGLTLKAKGITYLRTDHSGKDVSRGTRGSSAKNDDVDLVWRLTRTDTKDGHGVRLERTHSRIAWVPDQLKIRRIETDHGYDYQLDHQTSYPDGTRHNAETLANHQLHPNQCSQNEAIKQAANLGLLDHQGKPLGRNKIRHAWKMMTEHTRKAHNGLCADTFQTLASAPRRGEKPTGAPRATKTGGAPTEPSGAIGAPKGHTENQGGAVDNESGAVNNSPTGAPPPYRGGAPRPDPIF